MQENPSASPGFGADVLINPSAATYAVADVERTLLADEGSGDIAGNSDATTGGWFEAEAIAAS